MKDPELAAFSDGIFIEGLFNSGTLSSGQGVTLDYVPVPAPLPVLGMGVGWRLSRRLRRRIAP
ncbi:MAG: hypothetical protein VKK97_05115 [Synechococcaceae cyanobacterium]|nr:hypothetical protein [Synechococcaceae cyanobacterium]